MLNVIKSFALISILTLVVQSRAAMALDHRLDVEIGWTYYRMDNYLGQKLGWLYWNGDYYLAERQIEFSRDENYHLFNVAPEFSFWDQDGFSGHLRVDCTWEPDADEDEDEVELDLTLAYLSISNEILTLDLGHKLVQFGNGLIMLHDTPTASLELKRGKTFMTFQVAQVEGSSPMSGLSMGVRPGEFEQLELFGVWFQDNDDILGKSGSLNLRYLEIDSSGDLFWIGAAADLFIGQAYLTAVGAFQGGRIHLETVNQKIDLDMNAYFADLALEANLTHGTSLGVFCFMASGDTQPGQGDLKAALSIMAYNSRAAIFFDGDFMDRDDSETFAYSGVTHSGVIAPGLTLTIEPLHNLSLSVTAATFYAHKKLSDGSRWYGWEADLGLNYTFGDGYDLFATAGRFEHGDYFESVLDTKPDPATLLTVGVRIDF